jgi:uncharacterized protein
MKTLTTFAFALAAPLALGGCATKTAPDRSCEGFERCSAECERGAIGACTRAGEMQFWGAGAPRDPAKGLALVRRACESDEAAACAMLSGLHLVGRAVPRDAAKAEALLVRAATRYENECAGGDADSCAAATRIRRHGRPHVRDEKRAGEFEAKAIAIAAKGCRAGRVASCETLAEVVQALPKAGLNLPDSVKHLDTACDGGAAAACRVRGNQAAYGLGGSPKDAARAGAYYARAAELYNTGCASGRAHACVMLGATLQSDAKYLGERAADPAPAYGRACELGESFSCGYAAGEYRTPWKSRAADPARADDYDRRRFETLSADCAGGLGGACTDLSSALLAGRGAPADAGRAAELYRRGLGLLEADCQAEEWQACDRLAFLFGRYGTKPPGVSPDPAREKAMFERACQLSANEQSCQQAQLRAR